MARTHCCVCGKGLGSKTTLFMFRAPDGVTYFTCSDKHLRIVIQLDRIGLAPPDATTRSTLVVKPTTPSYIYVLLVAAILLVTSTLVYVGFFL